MQRSQKVIDQQVVRAYGNSRDNGSDRHLSQSIPSLGAAELSPSLLNSICYSIGLFLLKSTFFPPTHQSPPSTYLRVRLRGENVATTDTALPTGSQQSYRKQKSSSIRSISDAPPSLIASDSPPRRELRSTDRTSRETLIHCPRVLMVPL